MIIAAENPRHIVMWEHLLADEIDPLNPRPFRKFETMFATELNEAKKNGVVAPSPAAQDDVA